MSFSTISKACKLPENKDVNNSKGLWNHFDLAMVSLRSYFTVACDI